MIQIEEINSAPSFSSQLENKFLFSNHFSDISISYHSTYTIKYVINGVKYYNFNNKDFKVLNNQYLIINGSSLINTKAEKETRGLSLFLSPTLISEMSYLYLGDSTPPKFFEIIKRNSNQEIRKLLNKIVYLYENDRYYLNQQMEDLFLAVVELIFLEQISIEGTFERLKIVKHNTREELYKSIIKTKEYLNDSFRDKISLDMISKEIGLSKYYLHRLFKEINGSTPVEYLIRIRLENARQQLQYTKDSISDVANASGFESVAYFSNSFKKHFGLSPTQFRKAL